MYEDGRDPLYIFQSYRGLNRGGTLAFATLRGREQQGQVDDVAVMSGCSSGCCLIAFALSFGVFKLCGLLHASREGFLPNWRLFLGNSHFSLYGS